MDRLTIRAMAKVNLGLDVLRRREDGYHEVKMIMQTVDLYDELELIKKDEPGISVFCDTAELPCDEHNLIYKAVKHLTEFHEIPCGVEIALKKKIPIAAGMAGGSTDAAAALSGMNTLFSLGLSNDELAKIAVKIGADVPYCLYGGTYLSEGIGEILTPLPPAPDCYMVIAKPGIGVSTKYVYENLHIETVTKHPDIDGMIETIRQNDLQKMAAKMENVLETVTIKRYPEIDRMKKTLLANGALNALMSGSGPTVFALFTQEESAKRALSELSGTGLVKQGFVTKPARETCVIQ